MEDSCLILRQENFRYKDSSKPVTNINLTLWQWVYGSSTLYGAQLAHIYPMLDLNPHLDSQP